MQGKVIPEVLALHVRELASLWKRSLEAIRAADHRASDLAPLEARVAGHWDALLVAGESAALTLRDLLAEGDADMALAIGLTLSRLGGSPTQGVLLKAMSSLEGEALAAFAAGLGHGDLEPIRAALVSIAQSAPPARAVQAAGALATHGPAAPARLRELVENADPAVRLAAWRAVAYSGEGGGGGGRVGSGVGDGDAASDEDPDA